MEGNSIGSLAAVLVLLVITALQAAVALLLYIYYEHTVFGRGDYEDQDIQPTYNKIQKQHPDTGDDVEKALTVVHMGSCTCAPPKSSEASLAVAVHSGARLAKTSKAIVRGAINASKLVPMLLISQDMALLCIYIAERLSTNAKISDSLCCQRKLVKIQHGNEMVVCAQPFNLMSMYLASFARNTPERIRSLLITWDILKIASCCELALEPDPDPDILVSHVAEYRIMTCAPPPKAIVTGNSKSLMSLLPIFVILITPRMSPYISQYLANFALALPGRIRNALARGTLLKLASCREVFDTLTANVSLAMVKKEQRLIQSQKSIDQSTEILPRAAALNIQCSIDFLAGGAISFTFQRPSLVLLVLYPGIPITPSSCRELLETFVGNVSTAMVKREQRLIRSPKFNRNSNERLSRGILEFSIELLPGGGISITSVKLPFSCRVIYLALNVNPQIIFFTFYLAFLENMTNAAISQLLGDGLRISLDSCGQLITMKAPANAVADVDQSARAGDDAEGASQIISKDAMIVKLQKEFEDQEAEIRRLKAFLEKLSFDSELEEMVLNLDAFKVTNASSKTVIDRIGKAPIRPSPQKTPNADGLDFPQQSAGTSRQLARQSMSAMMDGPKPHALLASIQVTSFEANHPSASNVGAIPTAAAPNVPVTVESEPVQPPSSSSSSGASTAVNSNRASQKFWIN
ncbi:hypothetical protein HDU97_000536, partial [Phlyctochytrium planicorne]